MTTGRRGVFSAWAAGLARDDWDCGRKPLVRPGKALTIQPVLMYAVAQKRPATSWKSWGGVQSRPGGRRESRRRSRAS